MIANPTYFAPPAGALAVRVSDPEREHTVSVLREHWMVGRLNLEELEARTEEAWAARDVSDLWGAVRDLPAPGGPVAAPARAGRPPEAVGSIVLSLIGATVLLCSFGLLFFVALPLLGVGWTMGRGVRHDPAVTDGRSMARTGEIIGAIGTVVIGLGLALFAVLVAVT